MLTIAPLDAPDEVPAPLVMLLGPTASGKSAIALQLAQRLALEIVSVDSAQVYRGLDLGTAKPDARERAAVAHHLVDIAEPTERYSAARFVDDALAAIADIRRRGRIPLLVGGTMLYARALAQGLHRLPGADPQLRARLEAQAHALGWPALHARLARIDARAATRIDRSDAQRIQRALEIFETTGRSMSDWLDDPPPRPPTGDARILRIALEPADRTALHERIAARFDAMLAAGLVDEVRTLRARGDLTPTLPSMRSVGYRQVWQWLDAGRPIGELRAAGIAATRQLAKRQLTWLRAMPDRRIIDPFTTDAAAGVAQILETLENQ